MKNNLRYRDEYKNKIPKTKEEYWNWFNDNMCEYCIEPFPHKPLFIDQGEDYTVRDRKWYSYIFFPFPEYIRPEDIIGEYEFFVEDLAPDFEFLKWDCNFPLTMHYSPDSKVWDWDWEFSRSNVCRYNNCIETEKDHTVFPSQLDIYIHLFKDIEKTKKLIKELKKEKIQVKITIDKWGEEKILIRINKKNYNNFRQLLLRLPSLGIHVLYNYEEIRRRTTDDGVFLIV